MAGSYFADPSAERVLVGYRLRRTKAANPPLSTGSFMGSSQNLFKSCAKPRRETRREDFVGAGRCFRRLGRPHVIAVEGDVLPAERGDVSEKLVENGFAVRLVD